MASSHEPTACYAQLKPLTNGAQKKNAPDFFLGVEGILFSGVFAVSCGHGISLKLPVHNETMYFVQILWQTVRENPAKKKNRTSRYSLEIGASIVGKFMAFTGE